MLTPRIKAALVVLAASAGLSACTSYGPYGGSGIGVGLSYGSPYYGYGYGNPYYGSYYGGYPYFGWYDGFYYPGTGYYVYDRDRRPHRWTDAQRRYWERQRGTATASRGTAGILENWADFQNGSRTTNTVVRQRSVTTNAGTNHTVSEPVVRNRHVQTRQERRTDRAEVQQTRRGNRGGHNRHVETD